MVEKLFKHRGGLRRLHNVQKEEINDDGCPTESSIDQHNVEKNCLSAFKDFEMDDVNDPPLNRAKTVNHLRKGLRNLHGSYENLSDMRPWICFWISHALNLLGDKVCAGEAEDIVDFLSHCQNPDGGFGGSPGHTSTLTITYSAINTLCTLGTESAYKLINRKKLAKWIDSLRKPDGSFRSSTRNSEEDVRSVYCAVSIARLINISKPDLFKNTARWVLRCQTYEGGFGSNPGLEAHGGFTYCSVAALVLLDHGQSCNVDNLLKWLANRQMRLEGGFQGRTNKMVDSCYSFWNGGIFPLIHMLLINQDKLRPRGLLYDTDAHQAYVLKCCQCKNGSMTDRLGNGGDFYHTCYGLSGISVGQYLLSDTCDAVKKEINVVGPYSNRLVSVFVSYLKGQNK